MSAFSLLSIGSRAMAANYVALQTTGHNIANANVEGYSRQRVELSTAASNFTGEGYIGRGVEVKTISRAHDEFLSREAANTSSASSMDQARLESLRKLEEVFLTGEQGVGFAAGQFLNAMTEWASGPADLGLRQSVLARADEVATRFTDASRRMDDLQSDVSAALEDGALRINALAEGLAQVNAQLLAAAGTQGPSNELLDQRDRLLAQLSQKVQVRSLTSAGGTVSVFLGGARPLVLEGNATKLSLVNDPADPGRRALALSDGAGTITIDSDSLSGGDLIGLLRFQNEDLARARARLGQMASALSGMVNRQQGMGLDLQGQTGTDLFFDFHDTSAAGSLSMVRGNAANIGSTRPTLTISDPARLQAAEYTLSYNSGSGGWVLSSSLGGADIAATDAQDLGFTLTGLADLNTQDRFLLQPVTYAAGLMRRELTRPELLAAAAPVVSRADAANRGTVVMNSTRVVEQDADLVAAVRASDVVLTFSSLTAVSVSPPVGGVSALTWSPGRPLTLGGVELSFNGQPKPADLGPPAFAGDRFILSATTQTRQNNGNALQLSALADIAIVGRDAEGAGGMTLTDAYATAITDIGTKVQGATTAADISRAVADQAQLRKTNVDGVNLDEEAARLIQSQQAYQASAKVLQVAQSVFDTLLQVSS